MGAAEGDEGCSDLAIGEGETHHLKVDLQPFGRAGTSAGDQIEDRRRKGGTAVDRGKNSPRHAARPLLWVGIVCNAVRGRPSTALRERIGRTGGP